MSGDLTLQQLHQWRATLEAKFAVDGDLTVTTNPRRTGYHEFEILVPGYGLPLQAKIVHREFYSRSGDRWHLARYTYHLAEYARGGEFGYHWHPLAGAHRGRGSIFHIVCDRAGGGARRHFRAHQMGILEAHEALMQRVASDHPIDCAGLYRLDR